MIPFETFVLDNGLKVIVHQDTTVDTAVLNIVYDVGSRDEEAHKTGFAHLFEHLMFGGSVHIEDFDKAFNVIESGNCGKVILEW